MALTRVLLEEHNQLCDVRDHLSTDSGSLMQHLPEHEALRYWKGKKTDLEKRVAELRRMVFRAEHHKRVTIQLIAEEALLEIDEEDKHGNKLGHSYPIILERVRYYFPEARTTARGLAWYASKMRSAGIRVPYRPRAKNGFPNG